MRQHLDMRIETAAIYCLFTVLSQKWNDLWNGVLLIAYHITSWNTPDMLLAIFKNLLLLNAPYNPDA